MAKYLLVRADELDDINELIETIMREYRTRGTVRIKMADGEGLYYGFEYAADNLDNVQMMYFGYEEDE